MAGKDAMGPSVKEIPDGDNRERLVCPDCGYIEYENPRIIVAAVCEWEGRVLLCRRAIEPRQGFWTIPAGFLETGETMAIGAARETWEEALARVEMGRLVGIYEIPRISQVYVVFRARMTGPEFEPGDESTDVRLFDWADVPWDDLAFPSIAWALKRSREAAADAVHMDVHQE